MPAKIICAGCAALFLTSLSVAEKEQAPPEKAEDVLYVHVIEMLRTTREGGRHPAGSEADRFHHLAKAIEAAFQKAEFPMAREYIRSGKNLAADAKILRVFLHRWERVPIDQIETRIAVQFKKGEEKESLGIFVGRHSETGPRSSDFILEQYEQSARKAAAEMIPKLEAKLRSGPAGANAG